jgi:hypothetical protein
MNLVILILLVVAIVLFVLAAVGVPSPPRWNFIAGGLACWVLTTILSNVKL